MLLLLHHLKTTLLQMWSKLLQVEHVEQICSRWSKICSRWSNRSISLLLLATQHNAQSKVDDVGF